MKHETFRIFDHLPFRLESYWLTPPYTYSSLLVSMAPLSNEIRPVSGAFPPHLGPAIPEVSSIWFKMFLYHATGRGPPSLLLAKGTRVRRLPDQFLKCSR